MVTSLGELWMEGPGRSSEGEEGGSTALKVAGITLDITPAWPCALAGYTNRFGKCDQIETKLEANILIVEQKGTRSVVLVGLDTLFASDWLANNVLSRLQKLGSPLQKRDLIFIASHTHSAPSLDPSKPNLGEFDTDYGSMVSERLANAILALKGVGQTCTSLTYVQSVCEGAVYRRRKALQILPAPPFLQISYGMLPDPNQKIARDLEVLTFVSAARSPICTIVTWPCHAVASPFANRVDNDFVGEMRTAVREEIGQNIPTIYLPGFSGDIRPDFRPKFLEIRRWLATPFGAGLTFSRPTRHRFGKLTSQIRRAVKAAFNGQEHNSPVGKLHHVRQSLPLKELMDVEEGEIELGLLRIGGFDLCYLGAEMCSGHATTVRGELQNQALLTGNTGQVFGYWPTPTQVHEGGYEVDGFKTPFSLRAGGYKDNAQSKLKAAIRGLARAAKV